MLCSKWEWKVRNNPWRLNCVPLKVPHRVRHWQHLCIINSFLSAPAGRCPLPVRHSKERGAGGKIPTGISGDQITVQTSGLKGGRCWGVARLGLAVKGRPGWGDVEFIHRGQSIKPEPRKICSHIFLTSLNPKATHSLIPELFMFQGCGRTTGLQGLPGSQKSFPCYLKGTFCFESVFVDFQCCSWVGCTAFGFCSMSTNTLLLFLFFFNFFVPLGQYRWFE